MTDSLTNLSLNQKIFIFNFVNDDLQIIQKNGKFYLYDIVVDIILKEINTNYINENYNTLLKNSDKKIIKQILSNYNKFV